MGFDISIKLNLMLDEETGLPIVWSQNPFGTNNYNPIEYIVPKEYRKYLHQRGSHFQEYVGEFEGCSVDVKEFLESYPKWEDVCIHVSEPIHAAIPESAISNHVRGLIPNSVCIDSDTWSEAEHDSFRKALEWFSSKDCFMIEWSY